jgi:hypothetical protein
MDDAYLPFSTIVEEMLSFRGEIVQQGVRSRIHECEIEMPVELWVGRDAEGELAVGSTPPLYRLATTFLPSFHRVKVLATLTEDADGGAEQLVGP